MGPQVQPKCFRHAQHMRNNWELRKRGYLIRFGHTEALLLKKMTLNGHFSRPAETDPYVGWHLFSVTLSLSILWRRRVKMCRCVCCLQQKEEAGFEEFRMKVRFSYSLLAKYVFHMKSNVAVSLMLALSLSWYIYILNLCTFSFVCCICCLPSAFVFCFLQNEINHPFTNVRRSKLVLTRCISYLTPCTGALSEPFGFLSFAKAW